jgi:WD40 repeat protein
MPVASTLALALVLFAGADRSPESRANGESIYSLAFSADGHRLLAGTPRMVIVVDAASGRPQRTWHLGRPTGRQAWFLPDGRVVSAGSDRRGWRIRQGPFALAPDGRQLACSRRSNVEPTPEVVLVDLETGQQARRIRTAKDGDVYAIEFSPDGTLLAAVGMSDRDCAAEGVAYDCQDLWTWDVATGRLRSVSRVRGNAISAMSFSPDGTLLALGSGNPGAGQVQVWDVATARVLRSWTVEPDRVYTLAFSPDGRRLFTGGRFLTAMAWDPWTGRLVHRFPRIVESVVSLAVSPDGRFLAQGSGWRESRIALWDLATFARVW